MFSLRSALAVVLLLIGLCAAGCEVRSDRCPPGGCPPGWQVVPQRPRPYCPPRGPCPPARPIRAELVDLPEGDRQPNWRGPDQQGSCCWASLTSALRAQNQDELADYVEANYVSGCTYFDLVSACEELNLDYAYTTEGDPEILEWADRTHRAGVIFFYPAHAVTFMGFDQDARGNAYAVLLDNNRTSEYRYEPKDEFLARWRNEFGGFAIIPVHTPIPPQPIVR